MPVSTATPWGKKLTLARAFGNIQANARAGSAGYRGYAYVFGGVVLDPSRSASTSISRDWGLSWREERTFASSTFFAGPVPIRVSLEPRARWALALAFPLMAG